jgi:hypothetical protein
VKRAAFLVLTFFAAASVRAEEPAAAGDAAKPGQEEYVYKGEKTRDPFVPLQGQAGWDLSRTSSAEPEDFNPSGVELKGIIQTKNARLAVLKTPTGSSFLVKNGKIQDAKRQVVEGYVGIVKERSLVVIGPNNQVTELKLKKDKETPTP